MDIQKKQMQEVALLYYEKNLTQNEIAKIMNLSRQTVSKLLNDAVREGIVEIKVHDPETNCTELERELCNSFGLKNAVVCGVSTDNAELCLMKTVKKAAGYIGTLVEKGQQKIGISWGHTVQMLINEFESINTRNNTVFPLFGATDLEESRYLSNELARSFAEKIGASVKYAWFPYRPDHIDDCDLFKNTSYYKKLLELWSDIDIAVVGIGNSDIIREFGRTFGYSEGFVSAIGDISTHFFDSDGRFVDLYENTLCASKEDLKNAKETVAVACGADKVQAIIGALLTKTVDTLITDEYTATRILKQTVQIR